jgi:hypothetical protein
VAQADTHFFLTAGLSPRYFSHNQAWGLKIPAASCRESPTVRKSTIFRYAR